MIKVEKLSRKFGDFIAVNDVSFGIAVGEIVGLLGHNGAGKTTIMRMLTGFMEPSAGSVSIDSMDMAEYRARIQAKIGYLPENCPLYPEMTVIDYLDYAAGLHGIRAASRPEAVRQAIEQTELKDKATQPISTLSRGYQQRVGVAQAILNNPEILILDEPTSGLDPSQIQHMREIIAEFGKRSTVIISTHILQEVEAVCDRVMIIRSGKLALDSTLDDLQSNQRLMLFVDHGPDEVCGRLSAIQGVTGIEYLTCDDSRYHYELNIEADDDRRRCEIAAVISRTVTEQGYKLYALHPETRNLETVFREINSSTENHPGGQTHAN